MSEQLRRRFTYANVMATIAVVLALGGGSFAVASHLTVQASDIANNAVRAKHIKGGHVRTKHIRNGTVTRAKLAANVRPRTTGHVSLEAGSTQVLARSGPISLTAVCENNQGMIRLASSASQGRFVGVRYDGGTGPGVESDPVRIHGSVGETGVTILSTTVDLRLESGASFTVRAGTSTLSGEARAQQQGSDACGFSFSGLAG